jgi:hypothetical protein
MYSKSTYASLWTSIGDTYLNGRTAQISTFYVPDLRELFVKGSQTSSTYTVTGVSIELGQYQSMSVQQHYHTYSDEGDGSTNVDNESFINKSSVANNNTENKETSLNVYNSNDTLLTNETRPNCLGLNYIIKF